ncbi:hypothetical protein [Chryseobacterium sp. OSA05B]|uniref:hypothetical protein n=1 Tax=Chryseobacterium sp. OSA05B TaxID=2862650 RepID=UPI001CBD0053|nr:hypothetical protein [Chryseobacterium sp. OSA05B]
MSASYIPKDVYTICTFQTDAEPKQLIPTRGTITVFYGTDKTRPLLNIEDRNINEEFPCKSPKNAMWSFLCFGAGLIVGAALVLSGPVGWAVLAIGVGFMAYGVYKATKIDHMCSGSLEKGSWKIEHKTVNFDKKNAITQNSMLSCDAGGILTPIFSYAVAKKYAQEIDSNNSKEIGFNAVASFFGGAGFVVAAMEIGIAKTLLWMGGTMAFMHGATTGEKEIIRENSLEDNQHYQDMNTEVDPNSLIPGYVKDPLNSTPGDLGSPDILNIGKEGLSAPYFVNPFWYIRDIKGNVIEIRQGTQLAKDLQVLKNVDSREIWKTPEGKQIVENIRSGKYPNSMVVKSKDGLGTVRPRNLPALAEDLPKVRLQNIKNIGTAGVKGGGFIAFAFPFIATYFSEDSRKALANAMAEDAGNGINVVAKHG